MAVVEEIRNDVCVCVCMSCALISFISSRNVVECTMSRMSNQRRWRQSPGDQLLAK